MEALSHLSLVRAADAIMRAEARAGGAAGELAGVGAVRGW